MAKTNDIAIIARELLQGDHLVKGKAILVRDGKILDIARRIPNDFQKIDVGRYRLIPGFIDLHLHCDLAPSKASQKQAGVDDKVFAEHLNAISRNHVQFGTTRFLATFCTASLEKLKNYSRLFSSSNSQLEGALSLGVHLEGPFLNPKKAGAQPSEDMQNPSLEVLNDLLSTFGKNLCMMTLAPELQGIEEVIRTLKKHKLLIAMGHTDATYEEACRGIKAGIQYGTHLFNQMRGLHHRELGAAGSILLNDHVFAELIADGIHVDPLMVRLVTRVKPKGKIILATDCFIALKDDEAKCPPRLEEGALAGSALSLRRAVINLTKYSDLDVMDAVHLATINPARALGVDKEYGSLELGKWADIVVIDEKINVKMVFVAGDRVFCNVRK